MLFTTALFSAMALTAMAQFNPPSTYQEWLLMLQQQQQTPPSLDQPQFQPQQQQPKQPEQDTVDPPSPFPECVSIQSTSACAPWSSGFYINITELTKIYALSQPITTDIWNSQVLQTTSGGDHQATIWKNWSGCDGYNGELIQYSRSYVCLTDIFLFSAGCNAERKGSIEICDGVCDAYGEAVGKLVHDGKVCPDTEDKEIGRRREALKNASKGCKTILKNWNKPTISTCLNGVTDDSSSCGFSANQDVKTQYCSQNPTASCCSATPAILLSKLMSSIGEPSSSSPQSGLPLGGIIGITVSSLVVVGVVSLAIIKKRKGNKRKKASVAPYKKGMSAVKSTSPTTHAKDIRTVAITHKPEMNDEIACRVGDIVEVHEVYEDGWGRGLNVTTGTNGVFPVACLVKGGL